MKLKITVQGVAYEVDVEVLDESPSVVSAAPVKSVVASAPVASKPQLPVNTAQSVPLESDAPAIHSPLSGILVSFDVALGDEIALNQKVATIEAMKMHTPVFAEAAGKVGRILVASGEAVREGQVLFELASKAE